MIPQVICCDSAPYIVSAMGTFGGGYQEAGSRESLVARVARAMNYELYGRREVQLIAPKWVREELREMGFEV